MKHHTLKFSNHETSVLHELDDGTFPCPICGDPWPYPPYTPNDGKLGSVHSVSTPAYGDICECCDVEFGVEEGVSSYSRPGSMRAQWAKLRVDWLDRVNWDPASLKQLCDNLGISEEMVRRDAEDLRAGKLTP